VGDYEREKVDNDSALKMLIQGLEDFFLKMESCRENCQKAIDRNEEFDVEDGDLASNIGKSPLLF
jgi:hypothetical protein